MKFIYKENNEPQKKFIKSGSRYLLYLGGRGSGKSFGGCIKALKWCLRNKPTVGMIVSPTYNQNETIMEQLWDLMWNVEVGAEEKLYLSKFSQEGQPLIVKRYNKKDRVIELFNGSKVYFRSGDDPEKLRGYNLDWAYIDEAAQVDKMVFDNVDLCLRRGNEQQLWLTTTPKGYNWLYYSQEDFEIIRATTYDNEGNLPESYIERLNNLSGAWKEQEIYADFITMEGLVFNSSNYRILSIDSFLNIFARNEETTIVNKHIYKELNNSSKGTKGSSSIGLTPNNSSKSSTVNNGNLEVLPPHLRANQQISLAIGIDVGYTSQSAIIYTLKIGKDTFYTFAEHYEQGLTTDDLCSRLASGGHSEAVGLLVPKLEQFLDKKLPQPIYVDSARPDVIDHLRRKGFNAKPAKKDVMEGLDLMLRSNWFIAPECKFLLKELGMYSWGLGDKPVKNNDHAIDAARYSFMGLKGNREITYQALGFYESDTYYVKN